jgi:hypothetical protein
LGFKRPMLLRPAGRYGYLSLRFGDKKGAAGDACRAEVEGLN